MESEIIVRDYKTRDAKELLENAYPFEDIEEFGTGYKDFKLKIISFIEGRPRKRVVIYSLKDNKVVATSKADMITKNLWHNGGIFVIPSHRRRGLTKILQNFWDDYQKRIGVKKRCGNIEATNIPSISLSIKRMGNTFFRQSYYRCDGEIREKSSQDKIKGEENITLADFHRSDRDTLYYIYQECVDEEWCSILEIDKDNFLERFFGYTRAGGLLKLWIRNRVVIIRDNVNLIGYFHHTKRLLPIKNPKQKTVYLYLTPTKRTSNILGKILNSLKNEGHQEASLVFTNTNRIFMEEIADILQTDFQFKKRKFLVFYKFIQ